MACDLFRLACTKLINFHKQSFLSQIPATRRSGCDFYWLDGHFELPDYAETGQLSKFFGEITFDSEITLICSVKLLTLLFYPMVCLPCKSCKPHILPNVHFPFALLHQDYFFIKTTSHLFKALDCFFCYSSSWFSMLRFSVLTCLIQRFPILSSFSFLVSSIYLLSYTWRAVSTCRAILSL